MRDIHKYIYIQNIVVFGVVVTVVFFYTLVFSAVISLSLTLPLLSLVECARDSCSTLSLSLSRRHLTLRAMSDEQQQQQSSGIKPTAE